MENAAKVDIMDVRIGISDISRELQVRTTSTADEVVAVLNEALASNGSSSLLRNWPTLIWVPLKAGPWASALSDKHRP